MGTRIATSSFQLDPGIYADLSRVAPVVAYEKSLYGSSTTEDALLVGRALGDEAGAQELVDDAAAVVAAMRAELPGPAGRPYLYGQARGDVLPLVVGAENLST